MPHKAISFLVRAGYCLYVSSRCCTAIDSVSCVLRFCLAPAFPIVPPAHHFGSNSCPSMPGQDLALIFCAPGGAKLPDLAPVASPELLFETKSVYVVGFRATEQAAIGRKVVAEIPIISSHCTDPFDQRRSRSVAARQARSRREPSQAPQHEVPAAAVRPPGIDVPKGQCIEDATLYARRKRNSVGSKTCTGSPDAPSAWARA